MQLEQQPLVVLPIMMVVLHVPNACMYLLLECPQVKAEAEHDVPDACPSAASLSSSHRQSSSTHASDNQK